VKTRWRCEVLEIGQHAVEGEPPAGKALQRNLRFGDHVHKGDVLAIVSSDEPDENKKAPVDDRPPQTEIRARIDGVIVEKNINVGDVADTTLDLFKIADLSELEVLAHVLEEDLPMLEDLPEQRRRWNIYSKRDPQGKPLSGSFSQTGDIVDPNQHTALVMGWVDNAAGLLRVGQFVTATIELPADSSLVVIPGSALIGDKGSGEEDLAAVFVETSDKLREFMRRQVRIRRRDGTSVFINRQPTDDERKRGFETLQAGERVIVSGVGKLAAELKNAR
jgi:cobalt-zinc-cadmium efflux system membrane fusion protein